MQFLRTTAAPHAQENVLLLLMSTDWRLLDLGIAGQAGTEQPPFCTLAYGAPEVVAARASGDSIMLNAAQDVWALGVIACAPLRCVHATLLVRTRAVQALCMRHTSCDGWPGSLLQGFKRIRISCYCFMALATCRTGGAPPAVPLAAPDMRGRKAERVLACMKVSARRAPVAGSSC